MLQLIWINQAQTWRPLFNIIIEKVEPPTGYLDRPLQLLVTTIDTNDYVGRICIGKIERGVIKKNQNVAIIHKDGSSHNVKVSGLYVYDGLKRVEVERG